MTRDEYLQTVQKSPIFKNMRPELQQKVLDSTEAMMPKYLAILQEGDQTLGIAQNEFIQKSQTIVKTFSTEVKKLKTVKLKRDEKRAQEEDEKNSEQLLQTLSAM